MGNGPSAEELECVGYRVLGVQENSPASKVGLVSFFDFIVAANGVPLRALDNTFIEMIKASEEKPLPLTVFNYKAMASRDVVLVPSKNWPGQGMLGVTIRFDNYFNADEHVVRVLDIRPGSPADIAGLKSEKDYILGTAEKAFRDPDMLFAELVQSMEVPMEIFVYNTDSDEVRTCVILPSRKWGGEGCLGCEVGSGYIHRLPSNSRGTPGISVSSVKYNYHPVAGDTFHPPPAASNDIPPAPSSQPRAPSSQTAHNMFPPNRPNMSSNTNADPTAEGIFQKGANVLYFQEPSHSPHEATVLKVHYDDIANGPYYTILLTQEGREKQTVPGKLQRKIDAAVAVADPTHVKTEIIHATDAASAANTMQDQLQPEQKAEKLPEIRNDPTVASEDLSQTNEEPLNSSSLASVDLETPIPETKLKAEKLPEMRNDTTVASEDLSQTNEEPPNSSSLASVDLETPVPETKLQAEKLPERRNEPTVTSEDLSQTNEEPLNSTSLTSVALKTPIPETKLKETVPDFSVGNHAATDPSQQSDEAMKKDPCDSETITLPVPQPEPT